MWTSFTIIVARYEWNAPFSGVYWPSRSTFTSLPNTAMTMSSAFASLPFNAAKRRIASE